MAEQKESYIMSIPEKISGRLMGAIEDIGFGGTGFSPHAKSFHIVQPTENESLNGAPQDTYLLPRNLQEKIFKKRGYIRDHSGDYGLVKKAVGTNKYPIYQRSQDEANRSDLVVASNSETGGLWIPSEKGLVDPGDHPFAFYLHGITGEPYIKQWDLSNYGTDANGSNGSTISNTRISNKNDKINKRLNVARKFANILDRIGSPTVVTSGYIKAQPSSSAKLAGYRSGDYVNDLNTLLQNLQHNASKDAVYPRYNLIGEDKELIFEKDNPHSYVSLTLPEIVVTSKKSGGKLNYLNLMK